MVTDIKLFRIEDLISNIDPGQFGIEPSPDADLGFNMAGCKDYLGNVVKFLAKGQPAFLESLRITDFSGSDGLLRHNSSGDIEGGLITVAELNALISDGGIGIGGLQDAYEYGATINIGLGPMSFTTDVSGFDINVGGAPFSILNGTDYDSFSYGGANVLNHSSLLGTGTEVYAGAYSLEATDVTIESAGDVTLKDQYLSSEITLSESGESSLDTTSQSIVGAINDGFHKSVAGEIAGVTGEVNTAIDDVVLVEDASDSYSKKSSTKLSITNKYFSNINASADILLTSDTNRYLRIDPNSYDVYMPDATTMRDGDRFVITFNNITVDTTADVYDSIGQLIATVRPGDTPSQNHFYYHFILNSNSVAAGEWSVELVNGEGTEVYQIVNVSGAIILRDTRKVFVDYNSGYLDVTIDSACESKFWAGVQVVDTGGHAGDWPVRIGYNDGTFTPIHTLASANESCNIWYDSGWKFTTSTLVGQTDVYAPVVADGALLSWDSTSALWVNAPDTAIHTDKSGEIASVAEKTTLVAADSFVVENSEDSNSKARVLPDTIKDYAVNAEEIYEVPIAPLPNGDSALLQLERQRNGIDYSENFLMWQQVTIEDVTMSSIKKNQYGRPWGQLIPRVSSGSQQIRRTGTVRGGVFNLSAVVEKGDLPSIGWHRMYDAESASSMYFDIETGELGTASGSAIQSTAISRLGNAWLCEMVISTLSGKIAAIGDSLIWGSIGGAVQASKPMPEALEDIVAPQTVPNLAVSGATVRSMVEEQLVEAVGSVSWTFDSSLYPFRASNNATLALAGGSLSAAYNGTALPGASLAINNVGLEYTISGNIRADGTNAVEIYQSGQSTLFSGTSSASAQPFNVTYTATDGDVVFRVTSPGTAGTVLIDNLTVTCTATTNRATVAVLMGIGVNDIIASETNTDIMEGIDFCIDAIQDASLDSIVCKVAPWARYDDTKVTQTDALNELIAASSADRVIDTNKLGNAQRVLDPLWDSDGIHLNDAGYARYAELVFDGYHVQEYSNDVNAWLIMATADGTSSATVGDASSVGQYITQVQAKPGILATPYTYTNGQERDDYLVYDQKTPEALVGTLPLDVPGNISGSDGAFALTAIGYQTSSMVATDTFDLTFDLNGLTDFPYYAGESFFIDVMIHGMGDDTVVVWEGRFGFGWDTGPSPLLIAVEAFSVTESTPSTSGFSTPVLAVSGTHPDGAMSVTMTVISSVDCKWVAWLRGTKNSGGEVNNS